MTTTAATFCVGGKKRACRKNSNRREKMKVYQAINKVQAALSKTGISKDRTNTQGSGYKFRGIDDVYNAVAPLLAEYGLCILPRVLARSCEERTSKNGGALFYVTVEAEFDFVSAEDGSRHTVKTFGEAMDSGDKATNKAMSAAYKYAAFQAFSIPTEGDNDADAVTHQVAPRIAKVTERQAETLQALAGEVGADVAVFFAYVSKNTGSDIAKWSDIPATAYDSCIAALNKKRAA